MLAALASTLFLETEWSRGFKFDPGPLFQRQIDMSGPWMPVKSVEEEDVLPIVFSIATVSVGFVSVPHALGLLSLISLEH